MVAERRGRACGLAPGRGSRRAANRPLWIATWATPGTPGHAHQVADHEHLRVPGHGAVGLQRRAVPTRFALHRRPIGEQSRRAAMRRRRLPTPWWWPALVLDALRRRRRTALVDVDHPGAQCGPRRRPGQGRQGVARRGSSPNVGSSAGAGLEEHDPAPSAGSTCAEVARRLCRASSAIWPATSIPVGPPPTTTNVRCRHRSWLGRCVLGELEGLEDAGTDLERVVDGLQTGRVLGEALVAEVGVASRRRRRRGCRTA